MSMRIKVDYSGMGGFFLQDGGKYFPIFEKALCREGIVIRAKGKTNDGYALAFALKNAWKYRDVDTKTIEESISERVGKAIETAMRDPTVSKDSKIAGMD
jgi:hypothetical protein